MKYVFRLLIFAAALIAAVSLVVGLCMLGFNVARATGNVYVIATEGMQVRAANILMPNDEDTGDLTKYFTTQWLEQDAELAGQHAYEQDSITDFDHRVHLESVWAQPWADTATVTLVETVNTIKGSHPTGEFNEAGEEITEPCAPWEKRRYKITCVKLGSAWLIDHLEVTEVLEPDPTPTPEPELTPTPEPETTLAD